MLARLFCLLPGPNSINLFQVRGREKDRLLLHPQYINGNNAAKVNGVESLSTAEKRLKVDERPFVAGCSSHNCNWQRHCLLSAFGVLKSFNCLKLEKANSDDRAESAMRKTQSETATCGSVDIFRQKPKA